MQIIRIAQNAQYLQSIGVEPKNIDSLLQYLLSLEGDNRKQAVRRVRQNPSISIEELQKPAGKESYLKKQNIPEYIIQFSKSISDKYSVWISREVVNWLKSVKQWQNERNDKSIKVDENDSIKGIELAQILDKTDPVTGNYFKEISNQMIIEPRRIPLLNTRLWSPIIDWAESNSPDIMKMSLLEAQTHSQKWHQELAGKDVDETLTYKTNDVVYQFPDGWRIVKLSSSDCTPEGEMMGHCVGGYYRRVEEGTTQIYSLRDPKNKPHVTMEIMIPKTPKEEVKMLRSPNSSPVYKSIEITQIQGKENKEPIDEYKQYVKSWFDSLKQEGYQFEPIDLDYEEDIDITNFHEFKNRQDDYGIPMSFSGVGGDTYTWNKNLNDAYQQGLDRSGNFHEGETVEIFDQLILYAFEQNETDQFQKALYGFSEWADEQFEEWRSYSDEDTPYPYEEDFTSYYEESEEQPEFEAEGFEDTKKEVFDLEAYNEAVKSYDNYIGELQKDFPPTRMAEYLFSEFNRKMQDKNNEITSTGKINMIKIADKKIPSAEDIAAYVEALNIYLENDKIKDKRVATLVKRLPYPDSIRSGFSIEECKLIFQSVNYAWKKITGQDLMIEEQIDRSPKGLEGNYWMMTNGVILSGTNHFTIIKRNLDLFATLLNISTFVLHEKLASPPDEIIKTIIDHGGMRIFIKVDKTGYFQLSDDTYSKWGRKKIKGLDLKKRIVKVVDRETPYKGWNCGVTILL